MISGAEPRSDAATGSGAISSGSSVDTRDSCPRLQSVDLLNEHSLDHIPARFCRSIVRDDIAIRRLRETQSLHRERERERDNPASRDKSAAIESASYRKVPRDALRVEEKRALAHRRDRDSAAVVEHRGVFRRHPLDHSPNAPKFPQISPRHCAV